MIAGHTKFAPNRLFTTLAKNFYSSDCFNEASFVRVYQENSSVVFDKGGIVQCWQDVTQKYSNLSTHIMIFLAVNKVVMKIHELCYTGTLQNTPMHLTKGIHTPSYSPSYSL